VHVFSLLRDEFNCFDVVGDHPGSGAVVE